MKKEQRLADILERAIHIEAYNQTIDKRTENIESDLKNMVNIFLEKRLREIYEQTIAMGGRIETVKDSIEKHVSTVDERIQSIEARLTIMDEYKINEIINTLKNMEDMESLKEQIYPELSMHSFEKKVQIKKIYRIIVCGTGRWAKSLKEMLPANCEIVAFVDAIPQKKYFCGIEVVSFEKFVELYEQTDFTIVATEQSEEVKRIITQLMNQYDNVYICRGEKYACKYVDNMEVGTWFRLDALFQEKSNSMRKMATYSAYTLCDCNDVCYVVNSKYKTMIHDLCFDMNYQQKDIELFIELSKKYYDIPTDVQGYFMDIGANIGTTSIWVKKKINNNLKIIAIEALQENCKQFKCNCILNDIDETAYILSNAAVSNEENEIELMLSEDNLGDNRVCINGNLEETRKLEKVKTICLDRWLSNLDINMKDIKYIWMDVQAHEAFAIEGGINLFKNNTIPLFMEFWPSELKKNHSLERLIKVLMQCYSGFINVEWYKAGNQNIYDITELYKIAENYPDSSFDLFLIK